MQHQVYNTLSNDKEELYSLPRFTKFGEVEWAENVVPLSLFRKVRSLYASIADAKNVLLGYKSVLSTVAEVEYDCITPLAASSKLPMLFYKREDLTSIRAYKIRGAFYQISKILEEHPEDKNLKFVAASTGNHALGLLKSAEILKLNDVSIFVSENVLGFKKQKMQKIALELKKKGINAKIIVKGRFFDETNQMVKDLVASSENCFYIDPYNTHNALAGQGTIGLELLSQLERQLPKDNKLEELTVVVPIGGGGLISGISCALKTSMSKFSKLRNLKLKVIGVKLENFDSDYGDAIKVKTVGDNNQEYIQYFVDEKYEINDEVMKKGIDFVKSDLGVFVEGPSAGTLKPILEGIVKPSEKNALVCVLSGGNALL